MKNSKQNNKKAFSIAEALITLMIVGVAMSSAAPLISKTMKNSQVGNFQIMRLNRDLDSIRKDITNIKNNYVTKSYLTQVLTGYVTNAALDSKLSGYVTTGTLTDYAKISDLPDLTNYATNRDIANFLTSNDLGGYATAEQITALNDRILALENASSGVPSGTIAFFAASTCPTGWSRVPDTYNGRFPRFAGEYTISGHGDTADTTTTLSVGTTQEDAIRNIYGVVGALYGDTAKDESGSLRIGAFTPYKKTYTKYGGFGLPSGGDSIWNVSFNAQNVVPTAAENRPKSIALLGCRKDQL